MVVHVHVVVDIPMRFVYGLSADVLAGKGNNRVEEH